MLKSTGSLRSTEKGLRWKHYFAIPCLLSTYAQNLAASCSHGVKGVGLVKGLVQDTHPRTVAGTWTICKYRMFKDLPFL